jgi:type IV secretory pathway VirB2 component (pilin)
LAVCTLPTTLSKYASSASGSASARIAKWDVTVEGVTSAHSDPTVFWLLASYPRDELKGEGNARKFFTVRNHSEVAADITLRVVYSADPAAAPGAGSPAQTVGDVFLGGLGLTAAVTGVTHQGGTTWRFAPGLSADFYIDLKATSNPVAYWYREYKVFANAVQVD